MWAGEGSWGATLSGKTALPRNFLLRSLPSRELGRLSPLLQRVTLTPRRVLQHAGVPVEHLYFVEEGLVSVLANADQGSPVEIWLIGREGATGTAALLGISTSPLRHFVQIGGSALRISIEDLDRVIGELPQLRAALHGYLHVALVQSSQSAACGLRHSLLQRLARWLLTAQDRSAKNEIPVTQDLLARNLGVRRASISEAFKPLERAGVFAKKRGLIRILDRNRLEQIACRCYRVMRLRPDQLEQPRNKTGRFFVFPILLMLFEIESLAQ